MIFFLQINYGYPTVDQLMQQDANVRSDMNNFKMTLKHFFDFYGNNYDMLNQIVSANIGQWQERKKSSSERFVAIFTFIQFFHDNSFFFLIFI